MYWNDITCKQIAPVGSTPFSEVVNSFRLEIDSKAMRKVKPGQSLAVIFQTDSNSSIDFGISQVRTLIGT